MKMLERLDRLRGMLKAGFPRFLPLHLGLALAGFVLMLGVHEAIGDETMFNLALGMGWGLAAGLLAALLGERFAWGLLRRQNVQAVVLVAFAALGGGVWSAAEEGKSWYWFWLMLYGGGLISLALSSIAVLYSNRNERTLFVRLVLTVCSVGIAATLFFLSLLICHTAFNALIGGLPDRLVADLAILSFVVLAPVFTLCLLPTREGDEASSGQDAGKVLFWILLPAALILMGILYLYLLKILISRQMPEGMLNWFGSLVLAGYLFFWLSLRKYEHRFFRLFVRRGWMLLVPVLVFQVVGIVIRYRAYGLTDWRFAGMIVLALGIYALVLSALRKPPVSIFALGAVFALLFTVTPVNIIDLPVRDQESRLKAALERNGCLKDGHLVLPEGLDVGEEDSEIIRGAWDYLVSSCERRGWLSSEDEPQDLGSVRPMVWGRAAFTIGLCEDLRSAGRKKGVPVVSLPDFLKLKPAARRQGCDASWGLLDFSYPRNIALHDGESLRFPDYTALHRMPDGRWELTLEGTGDYDVTVQVGRLFEKAGTSVLQVRKITLDDETARWTLEKGLCLIVGRISFYGPVGETPDSGRVESAVLLETSPRE